MKTTFISLFLVVCLVYCIVHTSNAAVSCGTVNAKAGPCIKYATGKETTPSQDCCKGLTELASTVKTIDDKKAICRCIKAGVKNFAGVKDELMSNIPTACHINVGFPISQNTDCEKIQ